MRHESGISFDIILIILYIYIYIYHPTAVQVRHESVQSSSDQLEHNLHSMTRRNHKLEELVATLEQTKGNPDNPYSHLS